MAARKRTDEPDLTGPLSHQGEQQARTLHSIWATPTEVALYVAGQPDGVIDCRESGRHRYTGSRKALTDPGAPPFTDISPEGWYVREIPCDSCRHVNDDGTPGLPRVIRREWWHLLHNRRGIITDNGAQLVKARPVTLDSDYLNPAGQGRIKPRDVRAAVLSGHVRGMNINTITREIKERQAEQARLVREAYERTVARADAAAAQDAAPLRAVPDAG
jgi:hypothetical protein